MKEHSHFSIFSLFVSLSATPVRTSVYSYFISSLSAKALIGFLEGPFLFWTLIFLLCTNGLCLWIESKSFKFKRNWFSWFIFTSAFLKKLVKVISSGLNTLTFLVTTLDDFSASGKVFKLDACWNIGVIYKLTYSFQTWVGVGLAPF